MDLNTVWFLLIGVLLVGYAVLDGFDLGVGVLHLFAKSDHERRVHLNAIGPVWDGNEVWLLTAGGAMFAAFPIVYATVFSGFYLAFMLLLFALIFRAVSLEFRGQFENPRWRSFWDWAFGLGSLLPAVLYGVAIGNVIRGLPIGADGSLNVSLFALLNPYALLIGLFSLAMFVMHGAAFLAVRTEGELQERMARATVGAWTAFVVRIRASRIGSNGL
jgi:cytochrome d ubiquinol oxidase subunit II